jgi:hypothetical protein
LDGVVLASYPPAFATGEPDDPERFSRFGFLARVGFLKSRVYAKLFRSLILECYQTFNGYPLEFEPKATISIA